VKILLVFNEAELMARIYLCFHLLERRAQWSHTDFRCRSARRSAETFFSIYMQEQVSLQGKRRASDLVECTHRTVFATILLSLRRPVFKMKNEKWDHRICLFIRYSFFVFNRKQRPVTSFSFLCPVVPTPNLSSSQKILKSIGMPC
jgi:hypothetical protein